MPKKSRRTAARYAALSQKKKSKKRSLPQVPQQEITASTVEAPASILLEGSPGSAVEVDQVVRPEPPEYHYLTAELRRIGIIAGAMFAILIMLAFVLR